MPELPEVETVRRGLMAVFEGATLIKAEQNRADLRFPFPKDFVARLEGHKVHSLGRRSKYLLADIEADKVLIMHLGMSGSFRIETEQTKKMPGLFAHTRSKNEKHDHVAFHLAPPNAPNVKVIYNDPRRFGFMTLAKRSTLETHPLFEKLGIEPLGNALNGAFLSKRFANKKTPLKAALLDQRIVAGLGNIYVCEALWRSGLDPRRSANTISGRSGNGTKATERLAHDIRATLHDAIEAGGSSLRDHVRADGSLGYFQHTFAAYDREGEPCKRLGCDGTIQRIVQSNRSTFYCPSCQR
ncbi:DNA-(apurinic or apyrimidinic site) lyase [Roseibium hamelinense]|uniref:Formamidopyrimidine-DNA glycosylase n=1 Tax=Roseibium hamelinense TaxID=150831 RepID=A0A562T3C3_9HYPH|nr:bifunctional DNA-formamidopyrimidine glycosylase/DNA-(apurinic or apyrimidinic site) lyase [Roseibium hamelinense]MTI44691.1 bifunctional DNA-formamidopyrimidine glycosylase/DNA-(apurinic or apyrimidinic site) lyase [Roseibium hamelinense]TWI87320.1 DNA-(apurinic or apyrimidinic site) lyase [Roseibium hamelinense]